MLHFFLRLPLLCICDVIPKLVVCLSFHLTNYHIVIVTIWCRSKDYGGMEEANNVYSLTLDKAHKGLSCTNSALLE